MLTLRQEQIDGLAHSYHERFRQRVIAHARKKIKVKEDFSPELFDARLQESYDSCASLLDPYPDISESYVKLMIALFIISLDSPDSRDIAKYLRGTRVHPEARADCVYRLIRYGLRKRNRSETRAEYVNRLMRYETWKQNR